MCIAQRDHASSQMQPSAKYCGSYSQNDVPDSSKNVSLMDCIPLRNHSVYIHYDIQFVLPLLFTV